MTCPKFGNQTEHLVPVFPIRRPLSSYPHYVAAKLTRQQEQQVNGSVYTEPECLS